MTNELVSVVIPVYNGQNFIAAAIQSALDQTYPNIEILVVNDGSTDGTEQILKSFENCIFILKQQNSGQGIARNRAAADSNGEFIAFLDSDDLWDPLKIERQVTILKNFPEAVATYCDHRGIDASGNVIGKTGALGYPRASGQIFRQLLNGNCIATPSLAMVRRKAFEESGGFAEIESRRGEDYSLWLRLSLLGPVLYGLETLASVRRHPASQTKEWNFEYKVALPHLQALEQIQPFLEHTNDLQLSELVEKKLMENVLSAAWASRNLGNNTEARRLYLRYIRKKPYSIDGWVGFLKCLISDIEKTRQISSNRIHPNN